MAANLRVNLVASGHEIQQESLHGLSGEGMYVVIWAGSPEVELFHMDGRGR
jgi:hypothetical protein